MLTRHDTGEMVKLNYAGVEVSSEIDVRYNQDKEQKNYACKKTFLHERRHVIKYAERIRIIRHTSYVLLEFLDDERELADILGEAYEPPKKRNYNFIDDFDCYEEYLEDGIYGRYLANDDLEYFQNYIQPGEDDETEFD
ncbi:MAG: hypothetical protein ACOX1Y_06065 [Zhaonellaceae bacterium]